MSLRTAIFSTTSLVMLATGASADVTAKDIWTDWKGYMSGFGYEVEATEAMSGNSLIITDMKLGFALPEEEGDIAMTVDKVDFVDNGDGTVSITFPEVMPMKFIMTPNGGPSINAAVNYTTQNFKMTASGDPSKVTYDYSGDAIAFTLDELEIDGESLGDDIAKVAFNSTGVSGRTIMTVGALRAVEQAMTLASSTYSMRFKEPGGTDGFDMTGAIGKMTFNGQSTLPKTIDPNDFNAAMKAGFAIDGTFSYENSSSEFAITDRGDVMQGNSSAQYASAGIVMNKDKLEYDIDSTGIAFNLMGGEVPFPIEVAMGEMDINFMMPVAKSDVPSDFAVGLNLADFSTSEMLWSLVDPTGALPHDPATLSFDITGKAKWLFDLFDPEQMAAVEDGEMAPGELNALTLNKLLVSIAGAKLTGTGDFTFDNTDLESFDGMPKPTGAVDVELVGGNGLMDKLVEMGLLPQEQAMGARMMMGLFARPGEGEDTLKSKLEINEEGHIIANGQRIQ